MNLSSFRLEQFTKRPPVGYNRRDGRSSARWLRAARHVKDRRRSHGAAGDVRLHRRVRFACVLATFGNLYHRAQGDLRRGCVPRIHERDCR